MKRSEKLASFLTVAVIFEVHFNLWLYAKGWVQTYAYDAAVFAWAILCVFAAYFALKSVADDES